ncbi:MAG: hypothetical protein JJ901_09770 [Erythrobacter sp.]|uniref:hypothetical protein n=1 Tax=Erythrobacter sp. TaxID=1042 RepID=UPI001B01FDB4|nr:hypothetical protein [Erythrobacter sp.]MBO6768570.1 hypothetical protein [Erythrobacter sp.]
MRHLSGLLTAAIASFLGGLAVIFFQYYWWPEESSAAQRSQVEITPNFEVRLDLGAVSEIAGWFLPKDDLQRAVRDDDEISLFAYRIQNKGKKDISDIKLQIHAEDYRSEFSVVHAAITDAFRADLKVYGGGNDRWKHLPLKPTNATATTTIDLLKPNEAIILLLATNYSQSPELDIRSGGIDILAADDEDVSASSGPEAEIDLTWLIVLAFGIGGLLLGLGLSEQIHRAALNGIGFDYDELTTLVKEENAKKASDA